MSFVNVEQENAGIDAAAAVAAMSDRSGDAASLGTLQCVRG
jgi:hypothetical protein